MRSVTFLILISVLFVSFSCSKESKVNKDDTPLHKLVIRNLKEKAELTTLPVAMTNNTNTTSQEAVDEFGKFKNFFDQILPMLTVPEITTSSDILENKEVHSWLQAYESNNYIATYTIEKKTDKLSFVYNLSTGNGSVDFFKGSTLLNEKGGTILINPGVLISLDWEVLNEDFIFKVLSEGKVNTISINTVNKSGKMVLGTGVSYEWQEDGSGKKIDENDVVTTW